MSATATILKNLESRTIWDSIYYLLISQNDSYYRAARDRISLLEWVPFGRAALDARDFSRVAGTGTRRPDFSDNAPPLQFGFGSVSRFPGEPGDDSRNSGIDNWSVTIVPEGAPSCEIVPRNTYLPTHVFENHLSNPARHLPHPAGVVVTFGGVPPSESVGIALTATKAAFLDDSGTPSLSTLTLRTDNNGRAAFEHVPPSAEPFDRMDFEAGGSVDGVPFGCRGSVVSGLGALTALLRAAHLPRSIALLRRLWNDVLARAAPGRDAADLSSEETVRILSDDPALRRRLLEIVKKCPPLLQGMAIAKAVRSNRVALSRIDSVFEHFESYTGAQLRETIRQVRGYLADRELLANIVAPPEGSGLPPVPEASRGVAGDRTDLGNHYTFDNGCADGIGGGTSLAEGGGTRSTTR